MKGPSSSYDPQALAHAGTCLINFLEHADPPRDAHLFLITDAAQDYHDSTAPGTCPGLSRRFSRTSCPATPSEHHRHRRRPGLHRCGTRAAVSFLTCPASWTPVPGWSGP